MGRDAHAAEPLAPSADLALTAGPVALSSLQPPLYNKERSMTTYTKMFVALTLAILPLGCISETTGTVGTDPTTYLGAWELSVTTSPGCWPAFEIQFTLDDPPITETLMNVISTWGFGPGSANGLPLTGSLNFATEQFDLRFWKKAVTDGGLFAGPISDRAQLSGTFMNRGSAFALQDGCSAPATAIRTSS